MQSLLRVKVRSPLPFSKCQVTSEVLIITYTVFTILDICVGSFWCWSLLICFLLVSSQSVDPHRRLFWVMACHRARHLALYFSLLLLLHLERWWLTLHWISQYANDNQFLIYFDSSTSAPSLQLLSVVFRDILEWLTFSTKLVFETYKNWILSLWLKLQAA